MINITKKFPGTLANDGINFSVGKGEIHALLGENGAGKSTLMNILYGLYQPDEGEIHLRGKKVKIFSPKDSINLGIGMVHQHFMLIPTLTVAENIALIEKTGLNPVLNLKKIRKKLLEISKIGLEVDPDACIWQLSVGEQQRVEILKALYHGAELLILDEPTAVLTPAECEGFFEIIRSLSENGHSIVFITHKLKEVMEISHRVTVLRDGKKIATVNTEETNEKKLAKMMVGREILIDVSKEPLRSDSEKAVEIENLSAFDDRGLKALKEISFSIRRGEIYGIAGVDGNGQRELAEVICGLRKASGGKVTLNNSIITGLSPEKLIKEKISHIPEDRKTTGAIMNFTLFENALLGYFSSPPFSSGIWLNYGKAGEFAGELIENYNIKTTGRGAKASSLSGGNLQKLIIARELHREPAFIVAVHPTRGLDLGAIEYVHKTLLAERDRGTAILLISTDLNEILQLSDTVGVIYKGEIAGEFPADRTEVEEIGLLMAGGKAVND